MADTLKPHAILDRHVEALRIAAINDDYQRTKAIEALAAERDALAERVRVLESISETAADLVGLWRNQNIAGLSRPERNDAIASVRERLCVSIDKAKGPTP